MAQRLITTECYSTQIKINEHIRLLWLNMLYVLGELMKSNTGKKRRIRISVIILLVFLFLISAIFATVEITVGGQVRTLATLSKSGEEHPVFELNVNHSYDLDELLNSNVSTIAQLRDYVIKQETSGIPIPISDMYFGCSSYSAKNSDNEQVYGRNFDNADNSVAVLVHTKPDDGYESISTANMAFTGIDVTDNSLISTLTFLSAPYIPVDGMNEKGFTVSVLMLTGTPTNQSTGKPKISTTVAIRMMLDRASTVDEAVEMLKKYDMQSTMYAPYHFLLSDAQGNSAVIEYHKNEMRVIKADDNYQVCTNFWLSKNDKKDYDGLCERYKSINDSLSSTKGIVNSNKDGMKLLENASQEGTIWSEFYNQSKLSMDFVSRTDYENIKTYSVFDSLGNSYPFYLEIIIWIVIAGLFVFLFTKVKRKVK